MAQSEAFMPHLGEVFLEYQMMGRTRERRGNRHPAMAPHGCYPCRGADKWVTLAVRNEREWRAFCGVIEASALADDPRFSTLGSRLRNQDRLDALVAGVDLPARQARGDAAAAGARGAGGTCAGLLRRTPSTIPTSTSAATFRSYPTPTQGYTPSADPSGSSRTSRSRRPWPAPCLGEHNGYVLGEVLGLSDDTLRQLEREHVIGSVPLRGRRHGRRPKGREASVSYRFAMWTGSTASPSSKPKTRE